MSWRLGGQAVNFGRPSKENHLQTWENYWLKRGVSAESLAAWKLTNYSWDLKLMPQDLKEICEPEMLFPQAEEKLSCCVGSVFVSGVGVVSV